MTVDLTLKIIGDCTITNTSEYATYNYGVYTVKGLIISEESTGTLTVTAGTATNASNSTSAGIYVEEGDLTVNGGTLIGYGGKTGLFNYGVYVAEGNITVANNGTLKGICNEGEQKNKYGVYVAGESASITVSDNGELYGEAYDETNNTWGDGIGNTEQGSFSIDGGIVTAYGGKSAILWYADIDDNNYYYTAKVWHGDNEAAASEAGAQDISYIKNHGGTSDKFARYVRVAPQYNITFDATSGVFSDGVTTQEVLTDMYCKASPAGNPLRSGHTFSGWYDAETGGNKVTGDTVFTKDTTVYARWSEHSYTEKTVKSEALKTPATCTAAAVYYKSCGCGAISTTETFKSGSALGHSWGSGWANNEKAHWHECGRSGCTVTDNAAKGSYGQHTDQNSDKACDTCGYVMASAATLPAEGSVLKDAAGRAKYKVTEADDGDVEVTYTAPVKKTKTTVTIPATVTLSDGTVAEVTAIANKAFKDNKYVKKVTVGKNVEKIGKEAFSGAAKLTTVKLGKNVETIGSSAFAKCTALKSISLPAKVKKIGGKAFYGDKKLTTITIKSKKLTSSKVGKQAFKGVYSKAKVDVPKSKVRPTRSSSTRRASTGKPK